VKSVILGMSGGVDSSLAAHLLKRDGWRVIGVTFRFWEDDTSTAAGRAAESVADAARACQQIGIEHHAVDCREEFRRRIVEPFCAEYLAGRTPNPCVRCNPTMKFARLIAEAERFGADRIATGHYVRVETDGRPVLRKGLDPAKDQSYVLYGLPLETLARCVFPLGARRKEDVRRIARELGLESERMRDSQEICFIPDDDYAAFLKRRSGDRFRPGPIVDTRGVELGRHEGVHRFTLGQRRGLGIAVGEPRFVVRIEPKTATVVVGTPADTLARRFAVKDINWLSIAPPRDAIRADVKIRYTHRPRPAAIAPTSDRTARVTLDDPESAVTPGQAAVFYRDDVVLGGGTIDETLGPEPESEKS